MICDHPRESVDSHTEYEHDVCPHTETRRHGARMEHRTSNFKGKTAREDTRRIAKQVGIRKAGKVATVLTTDEPG